MSLLWLDDFDHYTAACVAQNYEDASSSANFEMTTGRYSDQALKLNDNGYIQKTLAANEAEIVIGFSLKIPVFPLTDEPTIQFRDNVTKQIYFLVNGSGAFQVYKGDGTLLGSFPISVDTWYFIEAKIKFDGAAGSIAVKFNGIAQITYSGDTTETANDYITNIYFRGESASLVIDDLYICDTAGGVNDDFLGDSKIENIIPSGAGYSTQWTPSAGLNYANVDDVIASVPCPDGDASCNISSNAAHIDSFAFSDLIVPSATIMGLQVSCNAKKDNAGAHSIKFFVRIAGVNYVSSTFALTDDYKYYSYCWDINPATSLAWLVADINAAEFGYQLVT